MKRTFLFSLLISTLLLTACSSQGAQNYNASKDVAQPQSTSGLVAPGAPVAPSVAEAKPATGGSTTTNVQQSADRIVIKNATMSIVVDDTTATVNSITRLTEDAGGFVVSLNTTQSSTSSGNKVQRAKMVVRVPAGKLNDAMAQIKKMAVEVNSENVSGQDVTSEYTDLKSQLGNLERAEKQMQTFLDQTKNTDETLKVYNQLVSIRQQIETIKGRLTFYEQSAALSSITLDITPNALNTPIQIVGWRPDGTVKESIEALVKILQNLADFLIRFSIVCMPFIILLGIPTFFFGRWAWKKWMKK